MALPLISEDILRHSNCVIWYSDEDEKERVNDAFISALERIGKKPSDGTSTHRFFIGIAYLCGIDVEPNFDRALELLTSAAADEKEPCYEAAEKLVDMYTNGEGVAPNAYEARRWQKSSWSNTRLSMKRTTLQTNTAALVPNTLSRC